MEDLRTAAGAAAFARLDPRTAAALLARAVARTRLLGGRRAAAARPLIAALLVVVTVAAVAHLIPLLAAAAATVLLCCAAFDAATVNAARARQFETPLQALTAALGPADAALVLAATMASLRDNPLGLPEPVQQARWLAALVLEVRKAAAQDCTDGHHAGCRHRRRPHGQLPAGSPPQLVAALTDGPV